MAITYPTPVRAFGMDFYVFPGSGGNLNVKVTFADSTTTTFPFSFAVGTTSKFLGYQDPRCITKVEFQDLSGQAAVNFDDHTFGCPPVRGWCESFPDWAYPFNSSPHGTRGWYLAEGLANEAGLIQDKFCSPSRGLFMYPTTDLMRDFKCYSNGKFVFSSWWCVPANSDPLQRSYLMLLNKPHTAGPGAFSMQVGANTTNVKFFPVGAQGTSTGDFISAGIPTVTNQWVNLCAFIDLSKDRMQVFYNGQMLANVRYRPILGSSLLNIHAVNVYGGDLGGSSWVDDLAVLRDCPRTYQIGKRDHWLFGPDGTPISPQLATLIPAANRVLFDAFPVDKYFAASFQNLPKGPCKNFNGQFLSVMRANPSVGASSNPDQLFLALKSNNSFAYSAGLGALTSTTWSTAGPRTVSVSLNSAILSEIDATGRLDMATRNFTSVDYARLMLWNCCPWWKGFTWDANDTTDIDFDSNGYLTATITGYGKVACDFGYSTGGVFTFANSPDFSDPDIWVTFSSVGRVNGSEGVAIGKVMLSGGESSAAITADFSNINPASVRVKLYNSSGTLLFDQVRPPTDLVKVPSPTSLILQKYGEECHSLREDRLLTITPTTVAVGGTPVNNVAQILITADSPSATRENVSSVEVDTAGVATLTISDVRANIEAGQSLSVLGGAVISRTADGLYVNNLVTSGDDGVAVNLPSEEGFRADFDVPNGLAEGAELQFRAFATKNGVADSNVGSIILRKVNGTHAFLADYTSVGSTTVRVKVLRQGIVVADLPGQTPSAVSALEIPDSCEKGGPVLDPPVKPCFWFNWSTATAIKVGTSTYSGDAVAILAEPSSSLTVTGYSRLEVSGGKVDEVFLKTPQTFRQFNGLVHLGDYLASKVAGTPITIEYRVPGTDEILDTEYATLNADGSFKAVCGLFGTVECLVKAPHWLKKKVLMAVTESSVEGLTVNLINGDVDGDNEVSVFDYLRLSNSFDRSVGDTGFDPDADLDGDGTVTVFDYLILSDHFDLRGDE
ncbi:MAG: dockerin type I repeat-containing protein [Armatimonadetes bacterium]|nr:dockerin type I repeat-containing protein [Armatimonadota bacterium]